MVLPCHISYISHCSQNSLIQGRTFTFRPLVTGVYSGRRWGQHRVRCLHVPSWPTPALNLRQTDTYWVENLGDKSCFHQTRSHSHGAGLGCDYSVSVDTISTAQILTARAALIWVGVAPWQCFVGTIYFLLEDWYNPLLFSRAWGYGV